MTSSSGPVRFDPSQRYNEDWDLWLRMSRFGPFVPIEQQVAWYRQHDTNLTKNAAAMTFFHARVWAKAWAIRKTPQHSAMPSVMCGRG